jgi:hypothetical protein
MFILKKHVTLYGIIILIEKTESAGQLINVIFFTLLLVIQYFKQKNILTKCPSLLWLLSGYNNSSNILSNTNFSNLKFPFFYKLVAIWPIIISATIVNHCGVGQNYHNAHIWFNYSAGPNCYNATFINLINTLSHDTNIVQ